MPALSEKLTGHIEEASAIYEKDGVTIAEYTVQPGGKQYNIPDKHLAGIYRRIVKEKTVNKIFFDRKINNTDDFINYFKNNNVELFIVSYYGQESGFFWLKEFFPCASFITYCLYKSFWGEHTLKISQSCIDFTFNRKDEYGDYRTNILLGLTPASNKLAIKFLSKNGMKIAGNIPNLISAGQNEKPIDGILSYRHRKNGISNRTILSLFSRK